MRAARAAINEGAVSRLAISMAWQGGSPPGKVGVSIRCGAHVLD